MFSESKYPKKINFILKTEALGGTLWAQGEEAFEDDIVRVAVALDFSHVETRIKWVGSACARPSVSQ